MVSFVSPSITTTTQAFVMMFNKAGTTEYSNMHVYLNTCNYSIYRMSTLMDDSLMKITIICMHVISLVWPYLKERSICYRYSYILDVVKSWLLDHTVTLQLI